MENRPELSGPVLRSVHYVPTDTYAIVPTIFLCRPMNTLYYGDNLKILRENVKDASVDLVYLDPPFNPNRNYNVLLRTNPAPRLSADNCY